MPATEESHSLDPSTRDNAIQLAQAVTRAYNELAAHLDPAIQRLALAEPGDDRIEAAMELFEVAGTANDRYFVQIGTAIQTHLIDPDIERFRQNKLAQLFSVGRPKAAGDVR